jgi:hypothetical protein
VTEFAAFEYLSCPGFTPEELRDACQRAVERIGLIWRLGPGDPLAAVDGAIIGNAVRVVGSWPKEHPFAHALAMHVDGPVESAILEGSARLDNGVVVLRGEGGGATIEPDGRWTSWGEIEDRAEVPAHSAKDVAGAIDRFLDDIAAEHLGFDRGEVQPFHVIQPAGWRAPQLDVREEETLPDAIALLRLPHGPRWDLSPRGLLYVAWRLEMAGVLDREARAPDLSRWGWRLLARFGWDVPPKAGDPRVAVLQAAWEEATHPERLAPEDGTIPAYKLDPAAPWLLGPAACAAACTALVDPQLGHNPSPAQRQFSEEAARFFASCVEGCRVVAPGAPLTDLITN